MFMERIKDFDDLIKRLQTATKKPRVVVPCPDDDHMQQVLEHALADGLADVTLVHGRPRSPWADSIAERFKERVMQFDTPDVDAAAVLAVDIVRQGDGDVLAKGLIHTANLLRAVLDKKFGLLATGATLSHITVAHIPAYSKMLLFMDAAVIPFPSLDQYRELVSYGIEACHRLGIEKPCVALINCTEKVSDTFPVTRMYEALIKESIAGSFKDAYLDGPMDVKAACDKQSGIIKGIKSPVIGNADVLIFPGIQSANTFYKTITLFAGARTAGILCGTTKPVVVSSRADSVESKFYSLVLACGFTVSETAQD